MGLRHAASGSSGSPAEAPARCAADSFRSKITPQAVLELQQTATAPSPPSQIQRSFGAVRQQRGYVLHPGKPAAMGCSGYHGAKRQWRVVASTMEPDGCGVAGASQQWRRHANNHSLGSPLRHLCAEHVARCIARGYTGRQRRVWPVAGAERQRGYLAPTTMPARASAVSQSRWHRRVGHWRPPGGEVVGTASR